MYFAYVGTLISVSIIDWVCFSTPERKLIHFEVLLWSEFAFLTPWASTPRVLVSKQFLRQSDKQETDKFRLRTCGVYSESSFPEPRLHVARLSPEHLMPTSLPTCVSAHSAEFLSRVFWTYTVCLFSVVVVFLEVLLLFTQMMKSLELPLHCSILQKTGFVPQNPATVWRHVSQ